LRHARAGGDARAVLGGRRRGRPSAEADGWTRARRDHAALLIERLRACHDADAPDPGCHRQLLDWSGAPLRDPALARSLARGWTLADQAPQRRPPRRRPR
jgi:hypothetical protein